MGLFDGRIDPARRRPRPGFDRTRRRPARRTGGARRRRAGPEPQRGRAAARLRDVRSLGPDRGRDPQPGRHATARAGAAPGVRTGRHAGSRRDPAGRRIIRPVKASRPGDRGGARQAGARSRGRDDRAGGPARRSRRGGERRRLPRRRRAVGSRRSPEPAADGVVVALAAGKAFSFGYPEHAELLARRGRRRRRVRSADRSAARAHRGAGGARWFPRGVHRRTVRQRRCASTDSAAGGIRCAGPRRVRGPDVSGRRPRRHPDVRRAVRVRAVHRTADTRLPRRRRDVRFLAARGGDAGRRPRIPPHRSHFRPRPTSRRGGSAAAPRTSWPTAPCTPGCTPAICTPMPPRIPARRPASSRPRRASSKLAG